MGTMNNAGTVLLTIADMSVIEAEIEVDETDIPTVQLGQKAKVTIDAIPDKTFTGEGHRDRQQPDPGDGHERRARQATNFKVVVTLDGEIPEVRPGFTCTADITTADARRRVSVPIQATDRPRADLRRDGQDRARAEDRQGAGGRRPARASRRRPSSSPGQTKKEIEGVFVVAATRPNGRVRAGQDRHRRRQVLRGPRRPQGRRPRGHRARSPRSRRALRRRR